MTRSISHGSRFDRLATAVARRAGRPGTFAAALSAVVLWAVLGPVAGFSDFWQLTINTGTTIITFLMVFVIQNSQNRDAAAVQIKLDELIRANARAHNSLLDLEEMSQEEIDRFHTMYEKLAEKAKKKETAAVRK